MCTKKIRQFLRRHFRLCVYTVMGCLGIVILLVSGVRADKPAVVASVSDRSLGDDLFKQIRIYISQRQNIDLMQEAMLAKRLSAALEDEKLSGISPDARRLIYHDVMSGARQMRLHMLMGYPEFQAKYRQYGSLGVALFLDALSAQPEKGTGQNGRDQDILKAVDVMIREAWLFCRPARDFLSLLVTESILGLGKVEAQIVQKVRAFYVAAAHLGRREEKRNLLRLNCRLAKTEQERFKFWDALAEQKAYRLLLRESLRHGGFDRLAQYWQKLLKRERLKGMQRRATLGFQVRRVS